MDTNEMERWLNHAATSLELSGDKSAADALRRIRDELPRIDAAMELARSTVEFTAKVNPVLMRHRSAHDRVIEVFGGDS